MAKVQLRKSFENLKKLYFSYCQAELFQALIEVEPKRV
jgi:hypothetical protein